MDMMFRRVACFLIVSLMAFAADAEGVRKEAKGAGRSRTTAVFAVSWLPGFCRIRSDRAECKAQAPGSFDATHFTLHGLWPVGKSYCGVEASVKAQDRQGKWLDLPQPELADDARVTLVAAMPGVQSGLDRHQWVRSGRCHSPTAGAYFEQQMRYLKVLNTSAVRDLFTERLGQEVSEQEVRQAFDAAFGVGAGERVRLQCATAGKVTIVTGLTIGLGEATSHLPVEKAESRAVSGPAGRAMEDKGDGSALRALILAADPIGGKCTIGLIQRVEAR